MIELIDILYLKTAFRKLSDRVTKLEEQPMYNVEYDKPETPAARRERIAVAALQGLLAGGQWESHDAPHPSILARYAVQQADALIAALDGEGGQS